jgi:thiosulfate/3-mercaptopyruvate sulfurtransferase
VTDDLISPAELHRVLGTASAPSLLDVRWQFAGPVGREQYLAGHIPGADYVDLDSELSAPSGPGGRRPLPSPEDFTTSMRRHGIRADRPVVVYDAADSSAAARGWWLLRYFGHRDVRLLDGGYGAWCDAGFPVTSDTHEGGGAAADAVSVDGSEFVAVPGGLPVLDAEAAARLADHGVLLDTRPRDQYLGQATRPGERAGHIPGARSAPTADSLTAQGRLRAPEQLQAGFAALGVTPTGPAVGVYCGAGILAAQQVLALRIAGIEAAMYPGSWSQWTLDPARPAATGPSL